MVKKSLFAAIAFAVAAPLFSQDTLAVKEKKSAFEPSLGVDFVTSYIWRGQHNANPSFQPYAGIGWKGLSLGIWGSFSVVPVESCKGTQQEIDITLAYAWKGLHVGITDYYTFENGHSFFTYGGIGESAHTFEGNVGYDFGFLSVDWFTNFACNDGTTAGGRRAFSSYLQIQAPFHFARLDWNAEVGIVPYYTNFYAEDNARRFHVNSVSLRAEYPIKCGKKFTLPVFAQCIANPSNGKFYFLGGFCAKIF